VNRDMTAHDFDYRILDRTSHRPWPMLERPWFMTQTWLDLLFAHWPVDATTLQAMVPRTLPLDLFDGQAWLSVVPFSMTNVAPRGVPALPWVSAFPEVNVRTYVRVGDRPGVYFFSLDAANPLAVRAARLLFNLPYYPASMTIDRGPDGIDYASRRSAGTSADLRLRYGPTGPSFEAHEGSLDYFLTERYCLYGTHRSGRPYRLEIHHPPWPLQRATATFTENTLVSAAGLPPPAVDPVLHFSARQDVIAWTPTPIAAP
jgi:uncharacterized protein